MAQSLKQQLKSRPYLPTIPEEIFEKLTSSNLKDITLGFLFLNRNNLIIECPKFTCISNCNIKLHPEITYKKVLIEILSFNFEIEIPLCNGCLYCFSYATSSPISEKTLELAVRDLIERLKRAYTYAYNINGILLKNIKINFESGSTSYYKEDYSDSFNRIINMRLNSLPFY